MKKVLIVDDDTIVRITLRSLIDWEELGYQIAADAIHGEQALLYLNSHPVDLIISDMKMPVMDGIGLLKELNKKEAMPRVIVLSGYDDFKLVREAFRLGAFDYLLKADLNGELLKSMLEKLDLESRGQEKRGKFGQEAASMEEGRLEPVISDSKQLAEMAVGKREPEEDFFHGKYLVVQFEIDDFQKHSVRFDENFEEQLIRPILEFAAQIPRVVSRCVLGAISPSRYVMLYRVRDSDPYEANVLSTLSQLIRVWNNYLNLPVSAGVSSLGNGAGEFLDRFEEAGGFLMLHCLKGKGKICCPWDKDVLDYGEALETKERYQRLLTALLVPDQLVVGEEKEALMAELYKAGLSRAKTVCLQLVCGLAWLLSDCHDDINALFPDEVNYYEKVGRLEDMSSLELWLNNYFRWIMDYAAHNSDRRQEDMMIRAKRFIRDNYANPELSLGSVAGFVGLNEKYFSSRFTREEGTTFSNYLTEVRMKKARELMDQTDMKIYEISQAVGYNSAEHFTRMFKRVYKISPGAYRK